MKMNFRRSLLMVSCLLLGLAPKLPAQQIVHPPPDRTVLPLADPDFLGHADEDPAKSTPDFPPEPAAPAGAPNIVLIITDDVGFGATEVFGGPIETPAFKYLADHGVRYNNFHTTSLCSPTRAALLTGRNHHSVASGVIMEAGTGYPGYNTLITQDKRGIGDILKLNGYNTAWFGKNHNVPDWHSSQSGPFTYWPTGLGFEYFYGFIGGDTNQWAPAIFENTRPLEPPHGVANYNFDEDMADKAVAWIKMNKSVAPNKPFFVYYATGTAHAPHHAPEDSIAHYATKFNSGWDAQRDATFANQKSMGIIPQNTVLTPRPKNENGEDLISAWPSGTDTTSQQQRELYARMMAVYAGALTHADEQIMRVIQAVEAVGEMDNTLFIYIQGDNGASAEGSAQGLLNEMTFFNNIPEPFEEVYARRGELGSRTTFNHYPIGWAHAMNTPFQWTKQIASHFGGTRNGMVMSWPGHIPEGGSIRQQFHHVIDIVPTILETTGLPTPTKVYGVAQAPIEGVSMKYTWSSPGAASTHRSQYFEMFANRAFYEDGWIATTTPVSPPWVSVPPGVPLDSYQWELYDLSSDFSESNNLAARPEHAAKLQALQTAFTNYAKMNQVYPIDGSKVNRLDVNNRPSNIRGLTRFPYSAGMTRIPEGSAPDLKNKSFKITADVDVKAGDSGVLMTQGGRFSGLGLYLSGGKPVFHYNLCDVQHFEAAGAQALTAGHHTIEVVFTYQGAPQAPGGSATATLKVDNATVATATLAQTIGYRMSLDETLDIGEDTGTAVSPTDRGGSHTYEVPYRFTGTLNSLVIEYTNPTASLQANNNL